MSQAEGSRRRIRLDLGYRGTDFHGWARQPEARTVQGLIEAGLETICGTPVRTVCLLYTSDAADDTASV